MRYPFLDESATLRIARARIRARTASDVSARGLDDLEQDLQADLRRRGEGAEFDPLGLESARSDIERVIQAATHDMDGLDQDQIEGRAAVLLHRALSESSATVPMLDDPAFWRYVALAHLWNFAAWRESKAFSSAAGEEAEGLSPEKFKVYVDGKRFTECVPARMWLRVNMLGGRDEHLASAVREGTDFWRSHILRVRLGEHPAIVRAMVRRQANEATRLATSPLRGLVKELTRTFNNLVPSVLEDEAADRLVAEIWDKWSR
ncbi:MAG: hypothetical protein F4078_06445 [Acidimicrobiia bacterium]|nr:hypothetical protein [Acidimicrobiia bacterium]MYJ13920.1 hypothetical protein [Acidimicrobiia bacterium]